MLCFFYMSIHFGYMRLHSSLFFSLRNKVLPWLMTEVTFEVIFPVEVHLVSVIWLTLIEGWLILIQVWTLVSLKSMLFSRLSPICEKKIWSIWLWDTNPRYPWNYLVYKYCFVLTLAWTVVSCEKVGKFRKFSETFWFNKYTREFSTTESDFLLHIEILA